MKIGIISDTHDHLENTKAGVQVFKNLGVAHVIHCGDIISPFVLPIFNAGFESFNALFGNNDGEWLLLSKLVQQFGLIHKPPAFFGIGGLKIAAFHEPMPDDAMAAMPVDLVVFGHTHEAVVREGRPVIVNPGECCGYLEGKPSVAVFDSESGKAEIIYLEK